MAKVEIKVPSLGESETEATLISWLKQEGDVVAVDEVLAEVESDKITMEITALDPGVLTGISKKVDDLVHPGEVIAYIDVDEKAAKAKPASDSGAAAKKEEAAPEKPIQSKQAAEPEKSVVTEQPVEPEAKKEPEKPVTKVSPARPVTQAVPDEGKLEERVPMTGLRKRIATRLKEAQNTAAILTTFNEVNMQPVMDMRAKYKDSFKSKYDVGLGFMSFFVHACCEALQQFPTVNAFIDGEDVVYRNYFDIGIAVSTDKGLVVPVLRDAGMLGFAEIERRIASFAEKARSGGLMPDDLKGGTFSITNGGVFGSLLSTPILNPPQSAILGMHAIQKRPVAVDDEIVIRPMMYLALSYDHRLIDGRDAVQFLVKVKEMLEYPAAPLLDL